MDQIPSKPSLYGMNLTQLQEVVKTLEMPAYTARQLAEWLYHKDVEHIAGMTNLSLANRNRLETTYELGLTPHSKVQESSDGTRKYLFPAGNGLYVEAAYIPEKTRSTLCLSTQVGCKMGCLFCMTGKQGFQKNLSAGQILNQIRSLPEKAQLTNIVYMGMGEPFDNPDAVMQSLEILTSAWGFAWSPRRITVSTIGILPSMERFLKESDCHLAVSLHSPFDDERRQLMPVQHIYPIDEVIRCIRSFDMGRQRRVSFEYIMFEGVNDTPRHVNALSRLLHGLRCRINLMRFHPVPGTPLRGSADDVITSFAESLNRKGIRTTIRASRGQDIDAACGLLSTRTLLKDRSKEY